MDCYFLQICSIIFGHREFGIYETICSCFSVSKNDGIVLRFSTTEVAVKGNGPSFHATGTQSSIT